MARPDPALLDAARYPYSTTIEPRFGDLDVNLHVNNVAMTTMLEEGRVRFHRQSGYRDSLGETTSMVANLNIDFLAETHFPEPLQVYCGILSLGRTSHVLGQLVTQEGKPVALSRTVLVTVGADGPVALQPAFLDQAAEWLLRP